MVGGGRRDDVPVAGYLAGEAGDGTGHCICTLSIDVLFRDGRIGLGFEGSGQSETLVDLAEDDDAGEFGAGVAGDEWVVEVYSCESACINGCL